MRTGAGASVGVVAKGMDVHTTLSVGVMTGDVPCNGGVGRLGGLLEDNGTGDLGVTTEYSDYIVGVVSVYCLYDLDILLSDMGMEMSRSDDPSTGHKL